MIEAILGSKSGERVLIFLTARETGYASEIAGFFSTDLYAVQKQMYRLESSDILAAEKLAERGCMNSIPVLYS
jgi:predicted transcriptional regulator